MRIDIPLDVILGVLVAATALAALVAAGTDKAGRVLAAILVALGALVAIEPYATLIRDRRIMEFLAVGLGVMAVILAWRMPNRIMGTVLGFSGLLIGLRVLEIIGSWARL